MSSSIELCKLLNIKPVYSMWINIGDLDNNYVKVYNKRYYKLISDNRYLFDNYNICPEISIEYVDFEKPDNFVKLQVLMAKYISLPFLSGYEFTYKKLVDEIILGCKYCLRDTNNKFIKDFIKQAQETEWTY